jgi:hypothetical protein
MTNRGFVLIARQLLSHPRFKPRGPFTQFEAWYWLIESAAYVARSGLQRSKPADHSS